MIGDWGDSMDPLQAEAMSRPTLLETQFLRKHTTLISPLRGCDQALTTRLLSSLLTPTGIVHPGRP